MVPESKVVSSGMYSVKMGINEDDVMFSKNAIQIKK